jgi:hypothetical protein
MKELSMPSYLAMITIIDPGAHVGGGPVYPTGPVDPGYGIPITGRPEHPIAQPPVGIWPKPEFPVVSPPIYYPPVIGGTPEHPIFYPPPGAPTHPIYLPDPIPPAPGSPSHPIVLPEPPPDKPLEPVIGWTALTGWVVVFVPSEGTNLPTPSGVAPGKK